jgi:hypothetical protein
MPPLCCRSASVTYSSSPGAEGPDKVKCSSHTEVTIMSTDYADLVAARKTCIACAELKLTNASDPLLKVYDTHGHIGPWTGWHGDTNAELMVIGQDWGGVKYYLKHKGREEDSNLTNINLQILLKSIGIEVNLPNQPRRKAKLFLTNAVLCHREYAQPLVSATGHTIHPPARYKACRSHAMASASDGHAADQPATRTQLNRGHAAVHKTGPTDAPGRVLCGNGTIWPKCFDGRSWRFANSFGQECHRQ